MKKLKPHVWCMWSSAPFNWRQSQLQRTPLTNNCSIPLHVHVWASDDLSRPSADVGRFNGDSLLPGPFWDGHVSGMYVPHKLASLSLLLTLEISSDALSKVSISWACGTSDQSHRNALAFSSVPPLWPAHLVVCWPAPSAIWMAFEDTMAGDGFLFWKVYWHVSWHRSGIMLSQVSPRKSIGSIKRSAHSSRQNWPRMWASLLTVSNHWAWETFWTFSKTVGWQSTSAFWNGAERSQIKFSLGALCISGWSFQHTVIILWWYVIYLRWSLCYRKCIFCPNNHQKLWLWQYVHPTSSVSYAKLIFSVSDY